MNDSRPGIYCYWKLLMKHLDWDRGKFFNGKPVYPRQFEIHLPSNHKEACNLNCPHCAGRLFIKELGYWEMEGLELLDNLQGKIPYHIYGGAYTEPLLNPYFMAFLHMTKKWGNHFGIHTNGSLLNELEENYGWLTELNRIATDNVDYLSISIDAGKPHSWAKTKGTKEYSIFEDIVEGIRKACRVRKRSTKGHAIRLCYLIAPESGDVANFSSIISLARELEVDSLRFSIPFGVYNQTFERVRKYKRDVEVVGDKRYWKMLEPLVSRDKNERPYVFYTGPEFTDIDRYTFKQCLYGYYQITCGADGYLYKCSTTATPTAPHCRLGKITSNLKEFNRLIMRNQNPKWDCQKMCFNHGLRGNRMALEINATYAEITNEKISNCA